MSPRTSQNWLTPPNGITVMASRQQKRTMIQMAMARESCVASKAVGRRNGVSKNSHLIIMKSLPSALGFHMALADTLSDIVLKRGGGRKGPSIIVIAGGSDVPVTSRDTTPQPWGRIHNILFQFVADPNLETVIVTNAGNSARRCPYVDTYPAIWAGKHTPLRHSEGSVIPRVVVGAATNQGAVATFSQNQGPPTIWAPGYANECANGQGSSGISIGQGTSFAAPMVG